MGWGPRKGKQRLRLRLSRLGAFTVEGLSSLPSELDSQTQGTFHLSLTKSSRHIAVRPIYDHIRPIEGYAPCSSRAGTHRESPAERHPPVSLPDTLPGSSTGVDTRTIRLDHGIRMEANGNDQRRAVRISELLPLGLSKISLQLSRDKASRRGSGGCRHLRSRKGPTTHGEIVEGSPGTAFTKRPGHEELSLHYPEMTIRTPVVKKPGTVAGLNWKAFHVRTKPDWPECVSSWKRVQWAFCVNVT